VMDRGDRHDARAVIRSVLAADCACAERDFLDDVVVGRPAEARPGRRPFPLPARPLLVATMGAGVVVSCHPERLAWVQAHLGPLHRDEVFSAPVIAQLAQYVAGDGQVLSGPELKHVCSRTDPRPIVAPERVEIAVVAGRDIARLYQYLGFLHALEYDPAAARPDVLATVATCAGEVVGIAGASADCERLWQIGVDVVARSRGRGIGRALVGRLTQEVLRRGRLPYYTTAVSNIPSGALAVGLGYWPGWVELYARDE
jgi:GNAT superfamily N-acetyltransferase